MSRPAQQKIVEFPAKDSSQPVVAAYEQPAVIRWTHWLIALATFVLIGSGLQIFLAFPSFGPKIPQHNLVRFPQGFHFFSPGNWIRRLSLGGWLAGGEMWHFTFMWIFAGSGLAYLLYQAISGRYRTLLFVPKDISGVWPMVKHYFFFRRRPPLTQQYNPLQKLAYTVAVALGIIALLSGLVLYNPVQFSWLAAAMGGFHYARIWHFAVMCALVLFIIGHVIMVAIHGWNNFMSMLTGWKKNPEYVNSEIEKS
ncbi:MAG TPA: cytochrome b/b6 domain-containing protein [Terriglobales bacterium]|nr:cytochrome b/b6 domain-containing protein [Terriglobales bacterium]